MSNFSFGFPASGNTPPPSDPQNNKLGVFQILHNKLLAIESQSNARYTHYDQQLFGFQHNLCKHEETIRFLTNTVENQDRLIAQLQVQITEPPPPIPTSDAPSTGRTTSKPAVIAAVQYTCKELIGVKASCNSDGSTKVIVWPAPHTELTEPRQSGGIELFSPNWMGDKKDHYNARFLKAVVTRVMEDSRVSFRWVVSELF